MKISTKKQWRLILNLQISSYVCKLLEKCNLVKLCSYTWQYHMFNYPTVKGICQKNISPPLIFYIVLQVQKTVVCCSHEQNPSPNLCRDIKNSILIKYFPWEQLYD